MTHRRIGQEILGFGAKAGRPASLDALLALAKAKLQVHLAVIAYNFKR